MLSFFKKHRQVILPALLVVAFVVTPVLTNISSAEIMSPTQIDGAVQEPSDEASLDSFCEGAETLLTLGINKIICGVTKAVLLLPMTLAAFFLWLSGVFLNYVINYTIIGLKTNLGELAGLNVAWGTIRDLINISFIFVLLYTAIGTILNLNGVNWKKTVGSVIIAAILINFSMFFTKVLIDASNIVTIAFYNAIVDPSAGGGLSNIVMDRLGLSSFYKIGEASVLKQFSLSRTAVIGIGGALFIGITAFSFFAIAIMLVIRYIMFIFLLILSPIAVVGSVIPNLGEHSKKWWSALTGQLLFAPIYMILLFIVLSIVKTPGSIDTSTAFSNLFTGHQGGGGTFDTVFIYVILIGLLFGALIIAQGVSKTGAKAANAMAGKMMFGTAGFAGRRTFGAFGRKLADSEKLKDMEAAGGIKGRFAKSMLLTGQKSQKASFDFRGSKLGGALGKNIDGGFGSSSGKGGYAAYIKEESKKQTDYANSLKPSDVVIDDAKQKVEAAKKIEVGDAERRAEYVARKSAEREAQKQFDLAEGERKEYESGLATGLHKFDPELVKHHREKASAAKKTLDEAQARAAVPVSKLTEDIKAKMVDVAQSEADEILGVDENEVVKRIAVERKLSVEKIKEQRKIDSDLDKEIKAKIKKGAGDRRKETFAESISKASIISPNRAGFIGKIKQSNRQAAAEIRKGKKSVEDKLKDILKEEGELKEKEDDKAASAGGTTPSPTPASGTPTPTP